MAKDIDTSPKGKIARGVNAVEAARKGRKAPRLAHLVGQKATPTSLKTLLNDCRSRLSQLRAVRDAAAKALADESEKVRAHYEQEGYLPGEQPGMKEDILGSSRRKAMVDRAIVIAKKTIYSAIEADVTKLMTQVLEDEERVKLAREAWASPIQVLLDMTLDSEKRRIYFDNLASAGQTGLVNAAKTALQNHDLPMAAAVITAIENLPKRSRDAMTISKDDIAEAALNERYFESTDMLAIAEFVLKDAHLTGREGLGRERTSTDTVALGVARTRAEEELGRSMEDKDTTWLPVVGGVEQKPAAKKEDKPTQDPKAVERAENFVLFNKAIQENRWDDARRIGKPYGWAEENTGDEE